MRVCVYMGVDVSVSASKSLKMFSYHILVTVYTDLNKYADLSPILKVYRPNTGSDDNKHLINGNTNVKTDENSWNEITAMVLL